MSTVGTATAYPDRLKNGHGQVRVTREGRVIASLADEQPFEIDGSVVIKGGSPWVDVRAYGAYVNGTTDDTLAAQDALNALAAAGGGVLYIPAGTMLVTEQVYSDITCMLRLTASGITIQGAGRDQTTIKVKDAGASARVYKAVIGRGGNVISDITIRDLTVDQNTDGNPIDGTYSLVNGRRNVIMPCPSDASLATTGDRLIVENVRVTGGCGTQTIVVGGKGSRISNCILDYMGNSYARDFDTSAIFIVNGDGCVIENCTITGRGPLGAEVEGAAGAYAARSAIETHSRNLHVRDNTISGFRYGGNITSYPHVGETGDPRYDRQNVSHNHISECHCGFRLWSHWTFQVSNASNTNPIQITVTQPTPLVTGDLVTITGVTGNNAANVTAKAITVIDAYNFTLNAVAGNGAYVSGGELVIGGDWSSRDNTIVGRGLDGLTLAHNQISLNRNAWYNADNTAFTLAGTAPRGIWLDSANTAGTRDLTIHGNIIRYMGTGANSSSDDNSDGLYLSAVVNPNGLTGFAGTSLPNNLNRNWQITDNTIINPIASGIHISARLSRCRISGNIIVNPGQTTANTTDIPNVNRAGIHLFGHLQFVSITNNLTMDDQATPTIVYGIATSEPYTMTYCHAVDNRMQILNPGAGTYLPFHGSNTAGKEWIVQHYDEPSGTAEYLRAKFGSEVRETANGVVRRQITAGTGAAWQQESYATALPTTGTWAVGDLVWNTAPALNAPVAWVCITAGTPGTWAEVAPLARRATVTLDFPSTAAGGYSDLTMTVTGAALSDFVTLGAPNGSIPAGGYYFAWVSATNTVTVRFVNPTAGALDPASGSFGAKVSTL